MSTAILYGAQGCARANAAARVASRAERRFRRRALGGLILLMPWIAILALILRWPGVRMPPARS